MTKEKKDKVSKKPKSKKGWHGESYAHHLASKGETIKDRKIKESFDEIILDKLEIAQRRLTAKQIAEKAGFSWQATNDHLKELGKKGLVKKIPIGERTYWKRKRLRDVT